MAIGRLIAVAALLVSTPAMALTTTFINELHYDNGASDVGEGVEIAGAAGTDLAGWRLIFYNGSSGASYADATLASIIPDLGNGYGTVFVEFAGIQNGAPDGLALVDSAGAVIQFLSYEGTFTAINDAAAGMSSRDIGVEEPADGPAGLSLQLAGTGLFYEDFQWTGPAAASYGRINDAQQFAPVPLPAALPMLLGALGVLLAHARTASGIGCSCPV